MEVISQRLEDSKARLRETSRLLGTGRSARELLHESQLARLLARLETMPVIKQAKGVLIAQNGCDADEAFTMLRSASQRANVPVRELAADIVRRASSREAPPRADSAMDAAMLPSRWRSARPQASISST